MGDDVGQIFPTASLHKDHSIWCALVFEKEYSHMGINSVNLDKVCKKMGFLTSYMKLEFPVNPVM